MNRDETHLAAGLLIDLAQGEVEAAARRPALLHLVTCRRCTEELEALRALEQPAVEHEAEVIAQQAPPLEEMALLVALPSSPPAFTAGALPDPATGVFLCRFDGARLELRAHRDGAGAIWLALHLDDASAAIGAVRGDALFDPRFHPGGWTARLEPPRGRRTLRLEIDAAGHTCIASLVL